MDSSSGYVSVNMSTSLGSTQSNSTKPKKLFGTKFWTPKTPEGGIKAFKCQSRALWILIITSALVIECNRTITQSFTLWHLLMDIVIIYEIFVNWRLVKLKNPIFNDGVWFDVPPRGWDFCVECHHHRPPRCHHCPVCDICILKRNHHCYFTGACIGLGNQKNFILFLFWDILGIIYALYHITPLLSKFYIPLNGSLKSIVGYFMPPFYIFLPLFGYTSWVGTFFMFLVVFLLAGCLVSGSLLINQIKLIVLNMTDYEAANQIKNYSKRGIAFNLRLIFGPNLLLLPLVLIWPKFNVKSRESDCIYGRPQYTKVM